MEAINALEDPQEIRIDFFSMFYCFSNSINQYSKSSNDFVILIVPFISSIKMKKVYPFLLLHIYLLRWKLNCLLIEERYL